MLIQDGTSITGEIDCIFMKIKSLIVMFDDYKSETCGFSPDNNEINASLHI